MKRNFFSLIRPCLTLLDNGQFYRKPFGWLYASVAVFFLLTPLLLVYSSIWWNSAYKEKAEAQKIYQQVLMPEFKKIKFSYESLSREVETLGKEMNNAIDCLTEATKQSDYYKQYVSYGPDYQQLYDNSLEVKRQWDSAYKDASDRWEVANTELETLKLNYEQVKVRYDKALADYQAAKDEFQMVNQFGAFFTLSHAAGGSYLAAFLLFSVMLLMLGLLNFLLWWSRLIDLKTLVRVQDKIVATPVASHFIQTVGESLGLSVGLWGFFTALIFFTCNLSIGQLGLHFTDLGIISLFLPFLVGFLIAFVFRVVSELLKAVLFMANNRYE